MVRVEPEHDTRVKVFVPWQRKDWIQQIRSLPNRAWNKAHQYWSVPKNEATFQQLIQLFGKDLKIAAALASQKEVPTIDKKTAIKLPKTCIIATPEHLAKSKGTYQKRTGIITIPKNRVPAAKFFKTIQQGARTFKVFIGEKIILEKDELAAKEYDSYKEKRRIAEKIKSIEELEKEMKQRRLDLKSKKKE